MEHLVPLQSVGHDHGKPWLTSSSARIGPPRFPPDEPSYPSMPAAAVPSDAILPWRASSVDQQGSQAPSNSSCPTSTSNAVQPLIQEPEPRVKKSLPRRIMNKITNEVSPVAIWELLSPRDYLYPFTLKRYLVLLGVLSIITGIVVSDHYFGWIGKAMAIARSNILPLLIVILGSEPILFLLILVTAKIPQLEGSAMRVDGSGRSGSDEENAGAAIEIPQRKNQTALVIPCHNSDTVALKKVLDSAYPFFRPRDIYLVDNGRSRYPKNSVFRNWTRKEHPDVKYIWSPIGSKIAAQLVGALAAKEYEYVLTVDDDVLLPPNYRCPSYLFKENTGAVAFPIKGISPEGNTPLFLVAWQDCEYRMSGLTKMAESRVCGVQFPHGAGWFCDRKVMIEMISEHHSLDFIADDVNSGFGMMKLNKKIAFDTQIILGTEVPTTVFGPNLNWWKQRLKSWEMGRHGLLLKLIWHLFFVNGQKTVSGFAAEKILLLYNICSIVIDWIRIPVIVTMAGDLNFWRTASLLFLTAALPPLLYNYTKCRHRPDLQVRLVAALTFPLYKILYLIVSVHGGIRCVLYYIGGHRRPKTVPQMIRDKDEQAFWLDPRFETNPAWLPDEGEKHARSKMFASK